jgi:hypothetical protein
MDDKYPFLRMSGSYTEQFSYPLIDRHQIMIDQILIQLQLEGAHFLSHPLNQAVLFNVVFSWRLGKLHANMLAGVITVWLQANYANETSAKERRTC